MFLWQQALLAAPERRVGEAPHSLATFLWGQFVTSLYIMIAQIKEMVPVIRSHVVWLWNGATAMTVLAPIIPIIAIPLSTCAIHMD